MVTLFRNISLFCVIVGFSNLCAMDLARLRNTRTPEEKLLHATLGDIFSSTKSLSDDSKKTVQKIINKRDDKNLLRLFQIGTLPPEIQQCIILKFCENDKALAAECLKLPSGVFTDLKWADDVVKARSLFLHKHIASELRLYNSEKDTVFTDVPTIFSLAKEIKIYESAYGKNEFKNLTRGTLGSVDTVISKSPILQRYWSGKYWGCTIQQKITWQRFYKYCERHLGESIEMGALIPFMPLCIKSMSRLIELFLCTKMIRQDLVNANIVIDAINKHLLSSDNPSVRNYQVPFKSMPDYSGWDYIKMCSPYAFFVLYLHAIDCIKYSPSAIYGFTSLCATIFSLWLAYVLEREDALLAAGGATVIWLGGLVLSSILRIHYQQKTKRVYINEISDFLKRTDIEIV